MIHYKVSYDQMIYPSKPDRSEIRKFWNFLEMLPRHPRVLIIGSNPELRDIAFVTNKEVTLCGVESASIDSMRRFMKYRKYINPQNEKQIEWNTIMNSESVSDRKVSNEDKYDMILSIDGHLNGLPFTEWDRFLDGICDRLENNGFFILKAINKPPGDWTVLSPEDIVSDWLYSKHRDNIGMLFMNLLLFCSHHQDVNGVAWSDVLDLAETRSAEMGWKWTEKERMEFTEKFGYLKESEKRLFCVEEQELRDMLSAERFYFQQICWGDDDSEKYKYTPIYVMGKQSSRTGGQPFVFGHGEPKPTDKSEKVWW